MTPLSRLLAQRIAQTGPISLADYMAECLFHPSYGYYTTRPPFGTEGDFTTSPEISQMFGELVGLSLAQYWMDMGKKRSVLVELGPGRGTLMSDIWRATRGVPGFHASVRIVMLEASPRLRDLQRQTLVDCPVEWIERIDQLPEEPMLLVANEFFDALPIRQFSRCPSGWQEILVGLVGDQLTLGKGAPAQFPALAHRLGDTVDGEIVEICPALASIAKTIGSRITTHGGTALIFDYGGWRSRGDTFQAIERHKFAQPLENPGLADLTAHVDFEALAQAARPAEHRYATQGQVLAALGIDQRAAVLAARLQGEARQSHLNAYHRLTHPSEMGSLFKVLALYHPDMPPPPGFA